MFTKEEVFVATDGSIHREQLSAETASFANFMQSRNYHDEDGCDTGRFAVEGFFYALKRKPVMLAWVLAQLEAEPTPVSFTHPCYNCGQPTADLQDFCSQACADETRMEASTQPL